MSFVVGMKKRKKMVFALPEVRQQLAGLPCLHWRRSGCAGVRTTEGETDDIHVGGSASEGQAKVGYHTNC